MNSVVLLTKLQLMQTLGVVRSAIEKRAGANGAMAGTALIGIVLFVCVAWLGYSAYSVVGALGLDEVVFDMLFLVCGVLTFALSLPAILSTFFGASDINDLLPLPVSPFAIAFSKALSALATSYLYTFVIIAAPLAGWGVAAGAGAGYWFAYALAVLLANFVSVCFRREESNLFGRRIVDDTIKQASAVFMMYVGFTLLGGAAISFFEGLPYLSCLFECASASGTVGLTCGLTPGLGAFSRIILMSFMFLGRVGGLTIVYAATKDLHRNVGRLPHEDIAVG